ncbi:E3 ubiquitin-protein ligase RSL1-like isoform X2 [Cornus florida]|uniref:E3 ubiquitin-protein ligase RSL1-like isoform X2 n=1 Tax=Cornus florida TaxID=4283 RepID=UPI002898281D|nr:E3 ubiquitin-protein ligase RSL1-like isoform X2 [Cornus florida]
MATTNDPDEELHTITAEQRREFMVARAVESDLDLAFHLQMEEAITASLSLQPSSSCSSPPPLPPHPPAAQSVSSSPSNDDVFNVVGLQTDEFEKFAQEFSDRCLTEAESRKTQEDLLRRIHDRKVALEIEHMSEDEWDDSGDYFERPFGEGTSKSVNNEICRVYFKGLVAEERLKDSKVSLTGIGVAICDSRDGLIFELKKPLLGDGKCRLVAEAKALIEGLNAALALDLKRVAFYCDYYPLHQYVTRRWSPKQRKMIALVNQVALLQKKFKYCNSFLKARNDIKFAIKLAREAIDSQINRPAEASGVKNLRANCVICLEDTDVGQMFSVDGCMHRFCFSCMKQHVEVKLLHGMVPKCPQEGCISELKLESCKKFLTPKLIEIMSQRIREASIPVTEKVYCPYPKCSALMSKSDVFEYSRTAFGSVRHAVRKCTTCQADFCIHCKVPWHSNMTCFEYKRKNPNHHTEESKLKTLAAKNLWRQCVKCNHMIELETGCYHMTCRCGYEFCYNCGGEWKEKKATCSCPLWDEDNIVDDEDLDEFDEEDEEFDEEDDDDGFDSDSDDYY